MSAVYCAGYWFTLGICIGIDDGKDRLAACIVILATATLWPVFWLYMGWGVFVSAARTTP